MKELQYLNLYFKKYSGRLTLGLIITIIATIFKIIVPKIIGDIVDVVKNYLDNTITDIEIVKQELITNITMILGAAILAGFFTFLMRQTFIVVSRYIEFDLKNEIFKQYQRLSLGFYKKNKTIKNRVKSNKDLFGRDINFSKIEFSEDNLPKYLIDNKEIYKNWII